MFPNPNPKFNFVNMALRLVHDLADDFLKFSAKGEKKKKEGEKKKEKQIGSWVEKECAR